MFEFLKKKPITSEPKKEVVEDTEEDLGMSWLELWEKLGKKVHNEDTKSVEEVLKEMLPRGPQNMKRKGSNVTMDMSVKPAMYDNDLPQFMVPFFDHGFIGWQACAFLAQNPYIKKACEIPAREAVAVGYELHYSVGDKDEDPSTDDKAEQEVLDELQYLTDKKMKMLDLVRDANVFKKMYGQIIAVPCFSTDMKKAMEKPYNPKAIRPNTYLGMKLVQPFWVTYQLTSEQVMNPASSGFYDPEFYVINGGQKIHKSWVRKLVTGALPDILKPVYYYGGIPLTQQIYERVYCAEKTANEAPKLALTKRLLIIDGNVNNLTANPESAYKTMKGVAELRDNMGFMVKNPNSTVNQIDTSLADFDALIMTQFQLVAAIAEMPVTKLMKTQLKGLANTGDYETKDYNSTLKEIQENDFNVLLEFHYELLCLSEKGKNLKLEVVWNEIDTPTALEQAQVESQNAQTDATYIGAGVIDAEELRTILRTNEDGRYRNLPEEMPEDLENFGDMMGEGEEQDTKSDQEKAEDWVDIFDSMDIEESDDPQEQAIIDYVEDDGNF